MNNFQQKKIIANIKNNKDIPYQNTSDVSLKTNQNIHAVTLNNAFQQMVDNDLFNERHLIAYNNNSYGAKISADIDEYSAEDGTKIFDQGISNLNSSLQIYKKVEKPLSATVVSCAEKTVNFFIETDFIDGSLIGTTDGLYQLKSVHDSLSTLIADGNFISYYQDSANLIIAATNKLYKLNTTYKESDQNFDISKAFNISVETNFNINCITVLDDIIYIGTANTGLKYCTVNNLSDIYDIQGIESSVKALTTIDVNGYTKILAATENAQYINENIVTFTKLRKINFKDKSLIKDYFYFNDKTYYVNANGNICFLNNNEIIDIKKFNVDGTQQALSVDSIYQYNSTTIYIVANKNVYEISPISTSTSTLDVTKLTNDNIPGLKRFSTFYDRYNVFFKNNTVWYNRNFGESLIQIQNLNITTDSILKFTNYNGNLYIITRTAIYILTEESKTETKFVDYNKNLNNYTNILNFVRIDSQLFGISSNSLVEINKNTSPNVYNFQNLNSNIKYVKQLNNSNNEKFNGKIFIGDGTKLLAYTNTSFKTRCLSINNVKDICFTRDYVVILSNDNTIRYFDISENISAYNLNNANSYSLPSDSKLDSLDYHIIALNNNNNQLSILENTYISKVNEFNYSNTSYSYISNDINSGNFATSGKLLYFNNFNQNLYLKDGSCFALNTLSKTEDRQFEIYFDENEIHELSTLNYVPISALNPVASINTNSIIYSRKTVYDDLVYNKYYLLFGKNTNNIISSYETKNNDLQIDSLSTLFYLETDDYNIISDISSSNVTANNVGFLTHTQSISGIVYDTVAAVASNAKAMYTNVGLQSQKLLSGGKYFAAPYPSDLSTAKEDVQLEIGLNTNNEITINNFRYLNKDIEGSYVLTTLTTLTSIVTSSYIGIDYVPTTVYTFNSTSSVSSYSFANNIFLYGPDGILKLNISVELSDSQTEDLTSYRNISAGNVKNVLTGNIQKLRSYKIGNSNSYGLLFLSVNNQLTSIVSSILKYTQSTSLTSPGLTSINTNENVQLNNVNISNITDFEIIDNKLYILSNNNLISGTFSNGSFTTSYSSENHNNKKLYRTAKSVVAINSTATVFEDKHFHNIDNRCFFVKQRNSNSISIYNENNINGQIISSIPNDITVANITGIRYVEPEVSYFNQQTYDYVISGSNEGLYIEDLIFNPRNLSVRANSLTISNIGSNIKFVGQFLPLTTVINDNIISVDIYLFATNSNIYGKVLNSSDTFTKISSANNIEIYEGEEICEKINGDIKDIFMYGNVNNNICYILTKDTNYYYVYKLVANIYINNESTENTILAKLNLTIEETLPIQYIQSVGNIEKVLIINNSNIAYYIENGTKTKGGIYTSQHIYELINKKVLTGISNYYINDSIAFLVPTTRSNHISVYNPNSNYTAYYLNSILGNINSFNIINNIAYVSYDTNLSSFSAYIPENNQAAGLQFNYDNNSYRATDLSEVNSFLRQKKVDNTLFSDTYQVQEGNRNRFVNIQTNSYQILVNSGSYNTNCNICSLIMTNDNSFRANIINNNEKIVKDFTISSDGLTQNILSIYGNQIAYMYNGEIYKTSSNEIYYYNGYSYGVLNYNNISNVYYISENVLFDATDTKNVYKYNEINQYQTLKKLNPINISAENIAISVGKYIDINNKKYILEDNKNLFEILGISGYSLCTDTILSSDYLFSNVIIDDTEINRFTADTKTRYMILSNNNIFYTYDFNEYLKYKNNLNFLISTDSNSTIKDINTFNIHEYLIATDDGLSCTKYQYAICANVFNQLTSEIQNKISTIVNNDISPEESSHLCCYHNDDNLIPYLNKNAVNVDFSNINIGYKKIPNDNNTLYKNDIVTNVEFDSQTPCLSAYQYIDNKYVQLSGISYIIKNYKSGLKEMYLNIPTTNTYYIPHLEGNIGCNFANNNLYRKNVNKNVIGNPCSSNNEVYLFVSKDQFEDQPLVEINGTSLPLSIYKDDEHTCMDAENYFHSYCLQSLVSEISDTQYLSTITKDVISNQNIATLTCNIEKYQEISANPNVKFVTSVDTIKVNNTQSGTVTTSTTSYVTYTSSYVTENELNSLSTDQFFDINSWRIKLRCFGTDEQSLILRKI